MLFILDFFNLAIHKKQPKRERGTCPHCGKEFFSVSNVNHHIKSHHPKTAKESKTQQTKRKSKISHSVDQTPPKRRKISPANVGDVRTDQSEGKIARLFEFEPLFNI